MHSLIMLVAGAANVYELRCDVLRYKQARHAVSKRYLLCPATLTIRHLKKLITSKLDVTPEYQVRLLPALFSPAGNLSLSIGLFIMSCKFKLGIGCRTYYVEYY